MDFVYCVDFVDFVDFDFQANRISTDSTYQQPPCKLTVSHPDNEIITEWRLFQVLDKLPPTATGMDNLPAWFLRLGAPVFCEPLAYLFNKSLATPVVPRQWKQASIRPVPKTATPLNHSDYLIIMCTVHSNGSNKK